MPVIYVTGIPRSGSTWAFNVVRLTMEELYGKVPHFGDRQVKDMPLLRNAVAKTHDFIEDRQPGSLIIHSTRDYSEAAESWRNLSPGVDVSAKHLQKLDHQWRPHADFMFHRRMINDRQDRICLVWSINRLLGQKHYDRAVRISDAVDNLRIPTKRIDPVTFLQPRHRG